MARRFFFRPWEEAPDYVEEQMKRANILFALWEGECIVSFNQQEDAQMLGAVQMPTNQHKQTQESQVSQGKVGTLFSRII